MIIRALKRLPKNLHGRLREMVAEFTDVFRTRLGNDPPVDVPPMKVEFDGLEKPVKVKQRTYSPAQLNFLKKKCEELVNLGFLYRNPHSKWACAPVVVPKEGPERFRFTGDHRPVNVQTKKNQWPMPHADAMMPRLTSATIFFLLDFLHGYWQFPLHPSSQECLSIHTPFGVFSPTRVPHGATNSVPYFQSTMEQLFETFDVLIWLDDILGYAATAVGLLENLRKVLEVCAIKGLKLNPRKCDLVANEVQFCGRIIDKNGVKFNPRNYSALVTMPPPTTVGALI